MRRDLDAAQPERRSAAEWFVALDEATAAGAASGDASPDDDAALARCAAAVAIARGLADDPELRWAYDEAKAIARGRPAPRERAHRYRRRLRSAGAGLAAAAVAAAALVWSLRVGPPRDEPERPGNASRAAEIVAFASPVAPVVLLPGGVAVDANSVAVLPFESAVDGAAKSAGALLQDAIVADLAIVPGIYVSRAASAAPYAATDLSAAEIGVQLGTRGIVSGRIEQRGAGIRVHAELADAATNRVVWRADYDTTAAELRSVRTELVDGIAATLVDPALRRSALRAASQGRIDNSVASTAAPALDR